MNRVVLYHANCIDGIVSAWVAWKKFGTTAKYFPVHYGTPPPDECVGAHEVYLIDFCYPPKVLEQMALGAEQVVVLDHHAIAHEASTKLNSTIPGLEIIYSEDRCGALLAWDYFFPESEYPYFLLLVDDYDRWQWKLPDTAEFHETILLQYTLTIDWVNRVYTQMKIDQKKWLEHGEILLQKKKLQAEEATSRALSYSFKGTPLMGVNCPRELNSLVGHKLAEHCISGIGFTWYRKNEDVVEYSVRSLPESILCALRLAQYFGGGGHKSGTAAGFISSKYPEQLFPRG